MARITRDQAQQQLVLLGKTLGVPTTTNYDSRPLTGELFITRKSNGRYSPVIASTDGGSYFHPFEIGTSYTLRELYDHLYFARTVLDYEHFINIRTTRPAQR